MSNVANRINLYGLDEDYRIVRYASVLRELLTSTRLMIEAISLRDTFGGLKVCTPWKTAKTCARPVMTH